MTFIQLVLKSFRFYFRRNLLVMAGIALSTAIISGGLIIGDSMRHSLKQIALSRLGTTDYVIASTDRYFTTQLADTLAGTTGLRVAPVLISAGSAIADGGQRRVNRVQFIAVDERFSGISETEIFSELRDNEVIINDHLARQLNVQAGDVLLFRLAKASLVPLNTPFVSDAETTVSFRSTIQSVAHAEQTGNLNLQNSQSTPYNVFLSLERLNRLMEFESRANHLLIDGEIPVNDLNSALDASLRPEDIGLKFKLLAGVAEYEITSDRIFLDSITGNLFSGVTGRKEILTYFVNSIRKDEKSVPYSFISSWEGLPLSDEEIILNDWTADDLNVREGDSVHLSYFEIGPLRQLVEKSHQLVAKQVVPMKQEYGDPSLMPHIPGLSDAGHCREWEAGVPIRLDDIRQKDEDYWNLYKGTPKAFISYGLAQKLWSNRYGNYTALRIPSSGFSESAYRKQFSQSCKAADFGLSVRSVREEGIRAASGGTDFGELFLSLSFFLLLSAILLTSLLFRLNLETRETQIGTLLQLGFSRKQVFRIFLTEGIILAIPGILIGLILAIAYVELVFHFLNSIWWDIVRTSVISLKINVTTIFTGFLVSLVLSGLSVWLPLRNLMKKQVVSLQQKIRGTGRPIKFKHRIWVGIALLVSGFSVVIYQIWTGESQHPGYFFLSGILLLAGMLWSFREWLRHAGSDTKQQPGFVRLIQLASARNPGRSMAIVIIFSLGAFLVVAVGANRQEFLPSSQDHTSGTGGYGFFAETVVPVLNDVNDPAFRLTEGMDSTWRMVQMFRMAGDDASCLNLNRVSNPSILGVETSELTGRFGFQTLSPGMDAGNPWLFLKTTLPGGVIPAVADQTVIQWGLGMKNGDTLLYLGENGDTLRLKLSGGLFPSVFQGYVLIDQSHFLKHYPSHSGSSVFLVDSHEESVKDDLENIYRDNGMDIIGAPEKLAMFQSVTNTYLSIFMALGFLALAIGTLGILVVLARTLLERRRELAIMQAIGFSGNQLILQLVYEYSGLLLIALGTGLLTSFLSLLPAAMEGSMTVSLSLSAVLFLGIFVHAVFWITLISCKQINRGNLTSALRNE